MTPRMRVAMFASVLIVALGSVSSPLAQTSVAPVNDVSNPYQTIDNYLKLPEGRTWGSLSAIDVDPDGRSIWVGERCGANTCAGSNLPTVLKFDPSGKLVRSFGAGMFIFPHGFHVDREGNVWVVDGLPPVLPNPPLPMGHRVVKFSPEGKVLLVLGTAGVPGSDETHFNQPSDVVTAPNGDIFVADGHGGKSNSRIVKFDKNGRFIKAWGKLGSGPGEMDTPHAIAVDSKGRIVLADRANNRLQIFDQDGKYITEFKQFSRPSGLFIDRNDVVYVADSESNKVRSRAEWKRGIRIGSLSDGKVTAFIPDANSNVDTGPLASTSGAEGVAVDADGNVYGAEVGQRGVKKYVRIKK